MASTYTVADYAEGRTPRGLALYLPTHQGAKLVTGLNLFSDGPWLVTGTGWSKSSWCVCPDTKLYAAAPDAELAAGRTTRNPY